MKMSNWEKRDLMNLFGPLFIVIVLPAIIVSVAVGSWIPMACLGSAAVAFAGIWYLMEFWDWLGRKIFPD